MELSKTYSPHEFEDRIYAKWVASGAFTANPDNVLSGAKKPYTIVIPPPNITGQLHVGHAFNNTLQDIIIRVKRMQGYETLWLPGTDHASIATESKIVAAMAEEGLTKESIGREEFLKRAWDWKVKYGGRIIGQLKKLGSSCDWSRERFTMDEGCSRAVQKVFVELYNKQQIYRGVRIVNWCPKCRTSISDVEVEFEEQQGNFWHISYPLKDGSGSLIIATTRPETMLGDTAVAVNPDDPRYSALVGKTLVLPLINREIPIVADSYVDKEFGTGAVKITPAHDPNDFEVGVRHSLPVIRVMDDGGAMNENAGVYQGLDRYKARKKIVADLDELGLLVKVEPHTHNVGTCQRCGTTVEPTASRQWFVKMDELAKPAIDIVKTGELKYVPKRFENMYLAWMENIRDWCVSRQLWWGHRIPAYYCDKCGETVVSETEVHSCPKCGGNVTQDPDTLDTWFSSALWPFSTLGYPDTESKDYKAFYPTQTLVTGFDIIPFWVARMIFSGLAYTGKKPFDAVIIHGIIRDAQGRKMSKTLGNGIDPLEVIDKFGADALRLAVVIGIAPGNDTRWTDDKILYARNFVNKLWNASRYLLLNLTGEETGILPVSLEPEDKWLITSLHGVIATVTENIENFDIGVAIGNLIDFFWKAFCDDYVELTKTRITTDINVRNVLTYALSVFLKLFHPFIPFVTEEIYSALPNVQGKLLITSEYPTVDKELILRIADEQTGLFGQVLESITAIRKLRKEKDIPDKAKVNIEIETPHTALFEYSAKFFVKLCNAESVIISDKVDEQGKTVTVCLDQRIFIPSGELFDKEKELARLNKELAKVSKEIEFSENKLNNPNFIAKAPEQQVAAEKERYAKNLEKKDTIQKSLHAIQ
ncbi:MAG: valine--tRNA ligase [Oscillospiraceae bacterium]|jgi:valyl-tRNA synthetase|nr:valine--tRNA ligase [Oscillospiraceae bacterium]